MYSKLRIAFRRLIKHRLFTLINIAGLITGMTASVLILYYVKYEKSYDSFNRRYDDIYRIRVERVSETGETVSFASSAPPAGLRIRSSFPEAEVVARTLRYKGTFTYEDIAWYEESIFFAEPELLSVFDFKVVSGAPEKDLGEQGKMFITRSAAIKYFGESDPVGKALRLDGKWSFTIAGIMEDAPDNSHLKFDFLLSWPDIKTIYGPAFEEAWGHTGVFTYVIFRPGTDIKDVDGRLTQLVEDEFGEALKHYKLTMTLPVQPLGDIHLGAGYMQEPETNGDRNRVNAMFIVALFIIVIVWVNYTVLSTAELTSGMAETGIRKIHGAQRSRIISERLTETFLLNIISLVLSIIIISLCAPLTGNLTGITYKGILADPHILGSLFVICAGGIIIAGLYPVLLISSAKPSSALKGRQSSSALNNIVRKILVVMQNSIALIIIISTMVVWFQYSFIKKADKGVDLENIITIKAPRIRPENYGSSLASFTRELQQMNGITTTAMATEVPGKQLYWDAGGIFRVGSDQSKNYQIIGTDYNYASLYNIRFLAGRNFSPDYPTDSMALILNHKACSWMGFESPEEAIGQKVNYWDEIYHIVGVTDDFRQRSARYEPEPTLIRFLPEGRGLMGNIVIKYNTDNIQALISDIKTLYLRFYPGNSFDYFFADEYYASQFGREKSTGKLFSLFTLISVLITILGVTGLTKYILDQQKKVISIRKIMGDTSSGITALFAKSFLSLTLLSSFIAIPASVIILSRWLETFSYHIRLSIPLFIIPLLFMLAITGLTVLLIVRREAHADPVKNLRYE